MRRTTPAWLARPPFLAVVSLALTGCAPAVAPTPTRSLTCAKERPCAIERPHLYEVRADLGFGEAPSATMQSKATEAEVTYVGRSAPTTWVRLPAEGRGSPLFLAVVGVVPLALIAGLLLSRSRTPRLRGVGRGLAGGTLVLGGAAMLVGGLTASPLLIVDNASPEPATIEVQGRTVALPPMSYARVSVTYPAVLETQLGGAPLETVVVEDPFSLGRRWRRLGSKEAIFVYSVGGEASYSLKVARYVKR